MLINWVSQTFRQDTAGMACRCSMIYIKLHIAGVSGTVWDKYLEALFLTYPMSGLG